MIKKTIRKIYKFVGYVFNGLCRVFWCIRDTVNKPKEKSILFIAHPDDDTLFFHTFIKEYKPYVVLLTDGWSIVRMKDFRKVMKKYAVKYRVYDLHSRDKRIDLLEKYVANSLKLSDFSVCATHNADGEYGHEMHIRVHSAVKKLSQCKLLVPALDNDIEKYPLSSEECEEKKKIFEKYYTTELFVLDMYNKWVVNEKLVEVE